MCNLSFRLIFHHNIIINSCINTCNQIQQQIVLYLHEYNNAGTLERRRQNKWLLSKCLANWLLGIFYCWFSSSGSSEWRYQDYDCLHHWLLSNTLHSCNKNVRRKSCLVLWRHSPQWTSSVYWNQFSLWQQLSECAQHWSFIVSCKYLLISYFPSSTIIYRICNSLV